MTNATIAERRTLRFASLEEVMPEVDRLLAGYTKTGKWTLGQTCGHLSKAIVSSVEGHDQMGPWLVRRTLGRIIMGRVIQQGRIKPGYPTLASFVPQPGEDDRAEAEALRAALRLFANHIGPMAEHPFGGRFTREQWERLHKIHTAHHLNFLIPAGSASQS